MSAHSNGGVTARVVADSLSHNGVRLITVEARFHRFVLAELNTHRRFSRNSASSRAIPIAKMIEAVMLDPAIPLEWGSNQPGMQAGAQLSDGAIQDCLETWLSARDSAADAAERLSGLGLHKQVANRLLEPFTWHTALISSTEWMNFFEQRCTPKEGEALAQPEMRALADAIHYAVDHSGPTPSSHHLPYITPYERGKLSIAEQMACSVARCCRVSTLTHGDTVANVEKDISLYKRLVSAKPPHWSPLEHVATSANGWPHPGNFDGDWLQLRHHFKQLKTIERELAGR